VDADVVDRTGLAGRFDVVLTWMPDPWVPLSAPRVQEPSAAERASIVAAIREQWGLALEAARPPSTMPPYAN